jgi:hypothetical protein
MRTYDEEVASSGPPNVQFTLKQPSAKTFLDWVYFFSLGCGQTVSEYRVSCSYPEWHVQKEGWGIAQIAFKDRGSRYGPLNVIFDVQSLNFPSSRAGIAVQVLYQPTDPHQHELRKYFGEVLAAVVKAYPEAKEEIEATGALDDWRVQQISDHGYDRIALRLWLEGYTATEIKNHLKTYMAEPPSAKTISNRLSVLRGIYKKRIVPFDDERKELGRKAARGTGTGRD